MDSSVSLRINCAFLVGSLDSLRIGCGFLGFLVDKLWILCGFLGYLVDKGRIPCGFLADKGWIRRSDGVRGKLSVALELFQQKWVLNSSHGDALLT